MRNGILPSFAALAAAVILAVATWPASGADEIVFKDVKQQTAQFMEWYKTIKLTPQQESVKKAALTALPAPCCSDNTAYTCCCECNVSRTIWGLSHYLIAKQGASATQVTAKVKKWIAFVNPNGSGGKACYSGGCARPFAKDGCGGMNPAQVTF
jgi:hypothetical protein